MRTFLLLLAFIVMGCPAWPSQHDDPADRSAELDESFEIAVGETVTVDDALQIRFEAVEEDSRCPLDVVCVWEGQAVVRLYLVALPRRGGPTVSLHLMDPEERSTSYGGYHITAQALEPYPVADEQTDPDAYRLELLVEEAR